MCLNPHCPVPVQSSSIPAAASSLLLACSFLTCPSNCSQRDSKKLTNLRLSRVLKLLYKIQTLHSGLEAPSSQGLCWPLLLVLSIRPNVKATRSTHLLHWHPQQSVNIISTIWIQTGPLCNTGRGGVGSGQRKSDPWDWTSSAEAARFWLRNAFEISYTECELA